MVMVTTTATTMTTTTITIKKNIYIYVYALKKNYLVVLLSANLERLSSLPYVTFFQYLHPSKGKGTPLTL